MEESRRQAYLQAMGIDCFSRLPEVAPDSVPQSRPVVPVARPSVPKRPRVSPPVVPVAAAAPDAVLAEKPATGEELRFALQFYRCGEQLAVLNELPFLAAGKTGAEEALLLDRILNALGKAPTRKLDKPELVFRWPLSDEESASAARQTEAQQLLQGMLRGRQALGRFQYLLVLAERGGLLLQPEGYTAREGTVSLPDIECEAVFTHSLNAMISVPSLKRPVWQALQPLVGILSGY